jgi:hypothetical protein
MNDINETTKTFPRTLGEAFPDTPARLHTPPDMDLIDVLLLVVCDWGLGLVVGLLVTGN